MSAVRIGVDLDAITHNVRTLSAGTAAQVLAVIKADAYGHGLGPVAVAARAGGAEWLGVAQPHEALHLRDLGDRGRVLTWLLGPYVEVGALLSRDIDISVNSVAMVRQVARAARELGLAARIHLAFDTGLGREGAPESQWPALVDAAREAAGAGQVQVEGLWSHLAWADAPGHPTVDAQAAAFVRARELASSVGLAPPLAHLANSAATLTRPDLHFTLVRPGIAIYGLPPVEDPAGEAWDLRPAMSVTSQVALVKALPAGHGVSYGHDYVTERDTQVAVIPVGYADGMFRAAGGHGIEVGIGGRRFPLVGRVCMDQVMVDLGSDAVVAEGDEVVLMGPGGPSAQDWARAADTIDYEVVCRWGIGRDKEYG